MMLLRWSLQSEPQQHVCECAWDKSQGYKNVHLFLLVLKVSVHSM